MPRKFEGERTMADAEQDALEERRAPGADTRCICGSERFVLGAYLEVEGGMPNPEPIEGEALTCPECGPEYEPVVVGERVLRRDFPCYSHHADQPRSPHHILPPP